MQLLAEPEDDNMEASLLPKTVVHVHQIVQYLDEDDPTPGIA